MQSNTVDVDAHAIDATLENMIEESGQPSPFNAPPPPQQEAAQLPVDWSGAMGSAMEVFAAIIAPNWELTDAEKNLLAVEGGKTLEAFFPNVILEGKWLALFMFAMASGGIVFKRFDPKTKKLKPRHLPEVAANESTIKPPTPTPTAPANVVEFPTPANRVVAPAWVGHGL